MIKKDFRYKEAGILDKTHFRFFTKNSIIRLFEESNFRIINIQGISETKRIFFKLFDLITLNFFHDMKYRQFAVVVKNNIYESTKK